MKRLVTLALILLMCCACAAAMAAEEIRMLAINVGKADSILLENGDCRYLIDLGTAESWGAISAALRVRGITSLDGVIVTHTDSDHTGSADALADSGIGVGAWYAPAYYTCKESKHPLVTAAARRGEKVIFLSAGDTLPFGDETLRVIGPLVKDEEKENNNSLVLRCDSAVGSLLLTGDMEFPEEETLIAKGLLSPVTVLKVANHANPDACSDALIRLTQPQYAVISTDSSVKKDTPATRILRTLKSVGASIAVTQSATTGVQVILTADGSEMTLVFDDLPEEVTGAAICDKSVAQDCICITNRGTDDIDLSGWYILSVRGSEIFTFPEGTVLQAGGHLSVSGLKGDETADFRWQEKTVWHKTKDDTARLYDAFGRLMDELE